MVNRSSYASDRESICFADESFVVDCLQCLSINTYVPRQVMAYSFSSFAFRERFTSLLMPDL